MPRLDLNGVIFLASSCLLLLLLGAMAGFYSYHTQNAFFRVIKGAQDGMQLLLDPQGREEAFAGYAYQHMQPNRGQGAGVTVNETPDDGATILLVGYFDDENQARLVRRDGSVVTKWSLDYLEHFPDPQARPCALEDPLAVDVHGALLSPEGDLVFNYEYCGSVKLDRCGGVQWTVNSATHHSITRAAAGGYWALGRFVHTTASDRNRFPPFTQVHALEEIDDDTLMRLSEDGEILEEVSIPRILYDSGLETVMTATGDKFVRSVPVRRELVHSNKVGELPADIADAFPMFEAGDLVMSMRDLNLIFVIDPETKQVKWWKTGPWRRQHDPEWRSDGTISVFNNNVYRLAYDATQRTRPEAPLITNIITVDPATNETEVVYGEKPGQEMLSVVRGQHEILPDGRMLIIEFDAGRVIEVDAAGETLWEYVNEYNAELVGEISNAHLFARDYFQTDFAGCP